mgnify:CR=1 FL=1
MNVSVVMATYNGEKYLIPQLNSIRDQSRKPDEVIICDDCSTDLTCKLISLYIKENQLDNWRLETNEKNVGWRQNFRNLLESASGDVIFFSDQDDTWDLNKIEKMSSIMERDEKIQLLACNYDFVYEKPGDKLSTPRAYYRPYGNERLTKVKLDKWWLNSIRSGATLSLKRGLVIDFLACWDKELPHDGLIESIANAKGAFYILNETLVIHRWHGDNNTPQYKHTKEQRLKMLNVTKNMGESVMANCGAQDRATLTTMKKLCDFEDRRVKFISNKKIRDILYLVLHCNHYIAIRSLFGDLMIAFREK